MQLDFLGLLHYKDFKAYYGERIGVVEANGVDKTTFLDIIAGRNTPDEGSVKLYGEISYVKQLDEQVDEEVDRFTSKELFREAEFEVQNCSKTVLIGGNGTGKSTLLKMIIDGNESIKLVNGVRLGYFSQGTDIIKDKYTILENVMKESVYPEHYTRTIIARMLLDTRLSMPGKGDDVECLDAEYKRILAEIKQLESNR